MVEPAYEHVAVAAGESVWWLGAMANEAEGLERRAAHGPVVMDGCLLVYPRREIDVDESGFSGLAAGDAGGGRDAFECHFGGFSVEEGSQDVLLKFTGY